MSIEDNEFNRKYSARNFFGWIFDISIIPHTYRRTNLVQTSPGAKINLECDVIAKYVERLLEFVDDSPKSSLRIEDLREQGY